MQKFMSNGNEIKVEVSEPVPAGDRAGERTVICRFHVSDGIEDHEERGIWKDGEGWEDDILGAWSPIIEKMFHLK